MNGNGDTAITEVRNRRHSQAWCRMAARWNGDRHKAYAKEVRDAIEKAGKRSKSTWDYLNQNYDTTFGRRNQVKK